MDPREDEVGNQFLMNMIADGNVEEEEAGADAHHHVKEEEAGDDDASYTNIFLSMSGDGIEQYDDGDDQQTENVYLYISNISFFYMYIYGTI
jgi:hypothetical protein